MLERPGLVRDAGHAEPRRRAAPGRRLVRPARRRASSSTRRWAGAGPANLLRDPRFSFVVEDGYDWVGVRGVAEALADPAQAQADIAAMARRYHADDPEKAERIIRDRFERQERISFLLHAHAVTEHPDD